MSESSEAKSFAAASSGKSPEEVAFELLNKLKGQGVWGERNMSAILDMYAECLDAAKGLRAYEGQNRVEVPIENPVAAATQLAVQDQAQGHIAEAMHLQAPQAPSGQPEHAVQAQQQALHQAFQPG